MANEELISEYIDRDGIAQDTKYFVDHLNQVKSVLVELSNLKIGISGADSLGKIIPATKEAQAAVEKYGDSVKKVTEAVEQQTVAARSQASADKELLNLSAKNQIELAKLSDERFKLKKAFDAGTLSESTYVAKLGEVIAAETAYKTELKDVTKSLNSQEKALQSLSGSIEEAKSKVTLLSQLRDKIQITSPEDVDRLREINAEIDKQNAFINDNSDKLTQRKINIGNYQGSAKIIVDAMERAREKVAQVDQEFGKASPEAHQARTEFEALGRITQNPQFLNIAAKVGDTNKELRFFTQRLNELEDAGLKNSAVYKQVQDRLAHLTDQIGDTRSQVKALSSDTRGFDLFAGSVSFAADAFQTFAGAAVLAGVSEEDAAAATKTLIAVQAVSNGVKSIATQLTEKGTAANVAYTAVQKLVATATDATATATARLAAATKLILGAFVIAAIAVIIEKFIEWKNAISETTRQAQLLNEVVREANKEAGKQIADLKLLVAAAENVNSSMAERLKAVKALQDQFPDYFKNLSQEAILNGDDKTSVDALTTSIIALARAKAAKAKIDDLEAQRLDVAFQKQKIINATNAESNRAKDQNINVSTGGGFTAGTTSQTVVDTKIEQQERIAARRKKAIAEQDAKDASLVQQENFLAAFAGEKELEKVVVEGAKTVNAAKVKGSKDTRDLAEADRKAQFDILRDNLELSKEFDLLQVQNDQLSFNLRTKGLIDFGNDSRHLIEAQAAFELSKAGLTATERESIENQKNNALIKLATDLGVRLQKITDDSFGTGTDKVAALVKGVGKDFAALQAETNKENEANTEKAKKSIEDVKAAYKKALISLSHELEGAFFDIFTNQIDKQKNKIQELIDQLDAQKAKDVEVANASIANVKDREAQIAIINARAQAQKEQLQLKQRQLEERKAKYDKAQSITSIIEATAIAVVEALGAKPFTPANIGLAVAVGAIGAVQIARILATPIPKYKMGTKDHPGGLAEVGHGMRELVEEPDGTSYVTSSTPTVMDLPRHTKVHPDAELAIRLGRSTPGGRQFMKNSDMPVQDVTGEIKSLKAALVSAIKNKTENHFHAPSGLDLIMRKTGDRQAEYLKRNLG